MTTANQTWAQNSDTHVADSYLGAKLSAAELAPTAFNSSGVTPSATITNDTVAHLSQAVAKIVVVLTNAGLATNTP